MHQLRCLYYIMSLNQCCSKTITTIFNKRRSTAKLEALILTLEDLMTQKQADLIIKENPITAGNLKNIASRL